MTKFASLMASMGSKFTALTLPVKVAVVSCTTLVAGGTVYGGVQIVEHVVEQQKQPHEIVLLAEEVNIEFGLPVSDNVLSYINLEKSNPELVEKATLDVSNLVENDGVVAVGNYEIILKAEDKEYIIKVNVADTVAPTWKDGLTSVETEVGQVPNYLEIFKAEDGSGVEITVNDSNVQYDTVGKYMMSLTAKDPYGNESMLDEIEVIVKEKEVAQKPTETAKPQEQTKPQQKPSETPKPSEPQKPSEPSKPQEPKPEEKPSEPEKLEKFPYKLFELTTYQGHYGFFTDGTSSKEAMLSLDLYPEGGLQKGFLVGYFEDIGGVEFIYNDDNPNNPLKK